MNNFISVVIPSYNHAHFLHRSINSVLDQKYDNLEILVIDNHSIDNTDDVVLGFDDNRIKLLKIYNEGIIAASRNLGIMIARGDWIAFLDADDYWYPTKFKAIMKSIESDEYDVISTDEVLIDQKHKKKKRLRYGSLTKSFYKKMLLYGNCMSTSATLVRRDYLISHNLYFSEKKEFITVEDYDYWMLLALNNARFKFIHRVEGAFVLHGKNNSMDKELHSNNLESLLKHHIFNVQQFESNANKLWNIVKSQMEMKLIIKSLKREISIYKLRNIISIIMKYPTHSCFTILKKAILLL
jgi:glycosyltransferase involved in cell wall biosynthesis|tara:strand:- start:6177 stop:7067 length:891 start_codon:yes stop_codon:yes gene_type:complete